MAVEILRRKQSLLASCSVACCVSVGGDVALLVCFQLRRRSSDHVSAAALSSSASSVNSAATNAHTQRVHTHKQQERAESSRVSTCSLEELLLRASLSVRLASRRRRCSLGPQKLDARLNNTKTTSKNPVAHLISFQDCARFLSVTQSHCVAHLKCVRLA